MDQDGGSEQPEKSREVRLGIVMYGGVSLAIYIYGVAQELFGAVRGRGVYRLVKALTDSDVVVDVVSGTSAGGINGILLSYALCNEREFGSVSSLWREKGDIATLLRSATAPVEQCLSVLDSRGVYLPALQGAFDELARHPCLERKDEDPSPVPELDLFVTGTHVAGKVYTTFDEQGHAIDVKDHRTVFWLKHRAGRKEPFNPASVLNVDSAITHAALAKLAAITSCFPVAFEPLEVRDCDPDDRTVDGKLQRWGRIGGAAHFLDGGVLDNKPFTSTIRAIFSRAADREVERCLYYVEPDPERFAQALRDEAAQPEPAPNVVRAATLALVGIPGYESIADDLKLLAERNSKVERFNRLLQRLEPSDLRPTGVDASGGTGDEVPPPTAVGQALYLQTRLVALSERVVAGLLRQNGWNQPLSGDRRERAGRLVTTFDEILNPATNGNWLQGAQKLLDEFDVYFRERRMVRVIYLIYDRLHPAGNKGKPSEEKRKPLADGLAHAYRQLLRVLNRQAKLYEVVRTAMENLVDEGPFAWESQAPDDLWKGVQAAFANLLDGNAPPGVVLRRHAAAIGDDSSAWLPQSVLTELNDVFRSEAQRLFSKIPKMQLTRPADFRTIFDELEKMEERILEKYIPAGDPVRLAYGEFRDVDARLYPAELFGELGERDVIRTVRISPCDAQTGFSARPMSEKLSGDAFHHFGGFFKRSWRSNDIMWGRLDGVCQLLECLVSVDRLRRVGEDDDLRKVVRRRLQTFDFNEVFPGAGDNARTRLAAWMFKLVDDDGTRRAEACDKDFPGMRALLIEAAQRELLGEELRGIVTDAIFEQTEWNRYRVDTTSPPKEEQSPWDPGAWRFVAGTGTIDPLVAITGAAESAREWLVTANGANDAAISPAETPLGKWFSGYRVGSEELQRDVPTVVLLGVLSQALLVVRNCLLQAMGSRRAAAVRRTGIYQLFVNGPLRAFDGCVRLVRAAPSASTPLKIGLFVAAVVALGGGVYLHWKEMASGLFAIALYVVAPLLVMWILVKLIFTDRKQRRRQADRPKRRGGDRPATKPPTPDHVRVETVVQSVGEGISEPSSESRQAAPPG